MRIAVFYFVYFVAQGCLVPYLPPYYESLGLTGAQFATLASIAPLIMVFAPPVWGFIADRSGNPARILQLAMLGSALSFLPMLATHSFAGLAAVLALQGLFATSITALADTVAVVEARRIGTDYGRLRLWGSLGFVVGATGFSAWIARGYAVETVLLAGAIGLFCAALTTLTLPQSKPAGTFVPPSLRDAARLLHNGAFVAFMLAGLLHWAAMQSYYLHYALHVKKLGLSTHYVGIGIACGIVTEVALMWSFRGMLKRMPLLPFLALAIGSSIIRWALTASLTAGPGLAATQAFHGLSFAVYYIGSIAYLEQNTPESLRATGRALLTALSWGIGGILGNHIAGRLYDWGGTAASYYGASALEALALIPLLLCGILNARRERASGAAETLPG